MDLYHCRKKTIIYTVLILLFCGLKLYTVDGFINLGYTIARILKNDYTFVPINSLVANNTELYKTIKEYFIRYQFDKNMIIIVVKKVVVFFPLGIFLYLENNINFNSRINTMMNIVYIGFIAVLAEVLQFILQIGYFDIDHIVLYTTGGIAGLIFTIFIKFVQTRRMIQRSTN